MSSFRALAFVALSLWIVGCGIQENNEPQTGLPVVQSADGNLYSIPCLREVAPQMESQGAGAMEQCRVGLGNDLNARGTYSCNKGSSCGGSSCGGSQSNCAYDYNYAYVYYPPTYYSYNYYDPYYSQPTYNPYKNYQYTTPFCGYVFGTTYGSWNCYYILGYGNQSYTNQYQSSCSPCGNSYGYGYSCPQSNSCWNTKPLYW